jgi:DNA-nicking Smr family endonuclease
MSRRLSAQEWALWSRVAASIRPIAGRLALLPPPPEPPTTAKPPRPPKPAPRRPPPPATPPPVAVRPRVPPRPIADATLDGGWDRRLRSGDIRPDRVIDLHGHTLAAAHDQLLMALEDGTAYGLRVLLVVTGKGRGDRPGRIRAELAGWLESATLRSRIAALRPAHPRHGGSGAFYIILRRNQ